MISPPPGRSELQRRQVMAVELEFAESGTAGSEWKIRLQGKFSSQWIPSLE
jgi:hypothetical protein